MKRRQKYKEDKIAILFSLEALKFLCVCCGGGGGGRGHVRKLNKLT